MAVASEATPALRGGGQSLASAPMRTTLIAVPSGVISLVLPNHLRNLRPATAEKDEELFQVFTDGAVAMLEHVLKRDGQSWKG